MISIDDFKKTEIKVGEIRTAEKVPDSDKLLKLSVDFGDAVSPTGEPTRDVRQIISGIAAYVPDPATLVGRKFPFVTNLEPRTIRGLESQGMILAVGGDGGFSFLSVDASISPGSAVK
mgnify:CR=1 FL=1